MKKTMGKVVNFQDYKEMKYQSEQERKELINLIKKVVTTK